MKVSGYGLPLLVALSIALVTLIVCTDPSQPDFNIEAEFTEDQIQTDGLPYIDSLFRLYVLAQGVEPLSFLWYKNDSALSGDTCDTLLFDALRLADGGTYTCIVWNEFAEDTTLPYSLTVFIPPFILKHPQSIGTVVGDSAEFSISVIGSVPLSCQWQKNGVNIPGATDSVYTTPTVVLTDNNAQYRCVVSNSAGSVTSNIAILTVTENSIKPEITGNPEDVSVVAGDSTTFSVSATGTTPLLYQWQKNDSDITGATAMTYTTTATTAADSGSLFRCIVSNNVGSDTSRAAMLKVNKVNHPPVCKDTALTAVEGVPVPVNIFATDPDSDPLTWTILQGPVNGKVTATSGNVIATAPEFSYTAKDLISSNTDPLKVQIDDGVHQIEVTVTITITADNDAPVIDTVPSVSAVEDVTTPYAISIAGHDPEGSALKWYIDKSPTKGTLDKLEGDISTGIEMQYTLKNDSCGVDSLTFYLLDPENNSSDTQTVHITITGVNDAPVINSQSTTLSCLEDNNLLLQLSHLNVTDIDNNISELSLIVIDSVHYKIVSGTTIVPDQNYNGPLTVYVKVSDGTDESDIFDMAVTVKPIDDKPVISFFNDLNYALFYSTTDITTILSDADKDLDSIFFYVNSVLTRKSKLNGNSTAYTYKWAHTVFNLKELGKSYGIEAIVTDTNGLRDTAVSTIIIVPSLVSDTLSVRVVLDANDIRNSVYDFITVKNGRIDTLKLSYASPKLTVLPPEIGNVTNLVRLDVWDQNLTSIPSEIGNLVNLDYINFTHNSLTTIPAEIGNLKKLTQFYFHYNVLTSIPSEVGNLENIRVFWLHENELKSLPNSLTSLNAVTDFSINQNRLPTDSQDPWALWADGLDGGNWRDNQKP